MNLSALENAPPIQARARWSSLTTLTCLVLLACSDPPSVSTETWPTPQGEFVESWRDDFDGPAGSAPDGSRWNFETRQVWFNDELQSTTESRKNSFLDGTGNLVIRAVREHDGTGQGQPFSSARLNTHGKLDQRYGRIEARMRLPAGGRGVWPAFWMLGSDIAQVGWPECAEIDILEMAGSEPHRVTGSLHAPGYYGGNSYNDHYELATGTFSEGFHTFGIEWTPEAIRWLVDGSEYFVKTAAAVERSGRRWAYDKSLYVILNLAVGGIFDGDPTPATPFPQDLVVDYVRVSDYRPQPP